MIRLISIAAVCVLMFGAAAQADILNVDTAVGSKVNAADAGWTAWVLPAAQSSASTSFAFAPATGGTLGATFTRLNGENYTNDTQIGAAAPQAVFSDHIAVAKLGADGVGYDLTLVGLPVGQTVTFTLYGSYAPGTEYGPGYPGYTDSSRLWKVAANADAGTTFAAWMTMSGGVMVGSPVTTSFTATGTDVIHVTDSYGYGTLMDGFTVQAAVPEPATLALLVMGGIGMLVRRKR
jgi:hypothetical protein